MTGCGAGVATGEADGDDTWGGDAAGADAGVGSGAATLVEGGAGVGWVAAGRACCRSRRLFGSSPVDDGADAGAGVGAGGVAVEAGDGGSGEGEGAPGIASGLSIFGRLVTDVPDPAP